MGIDWARARAWYPEAREELGLMAKEAGIDRDRMANITAILSIQKSWPANKKLAKRFLAGYRQGHFRMAISMAEKALEGQAIEACTKGLKVRNFAHALAGDDNAVVIDRHMLRWAGEPISQNKARYRRVERKVRALAKLYLEAPATVQAGIWLERTGS